MTTEITENTSADHFIWDDLFLDKEEREKFGDTKYAQWILMHYRLPASENSRWKAFISHHKLYCEYEGETYAVIGASRMGDIWLTKNLKGVFPYEKRVCVYDCRNFRAFVDPLSGNLDTFEACLESMQHIPELNNAVFNDDELWKNAGCPNDQRPAFKLGWDSRDHIAIRKERALQHDLDSALKELNELKDKHNRLLAKISPAGD